jgi:hypothetical protein
MPLLPHLQPVPDLGATVEFTLKKTRETIRGMLRKYDNESMTIRPIDSEENFLDNERIIKFSEVSDRIATAVTKVATKSEDAICICKMDGHKIVNPACKAVHGYSWHKYPDGSMSLEADGMSLEEPRLHSVNKNHGFTSELNAANCKLHAKGGICNNTTCSTGCTYYKGTLVTHRKRRFDMQMFIKIVTCIVGATCVFVAFKEIHSNNGIMFAALATILFNQVFMSK